jgi:hypothetical protein
MDMLKIIFFLFLVFSSYQKTLAQEFSLLGEWEGSSPKQEKILYNFTEDNTVVWTIIPQNNIKQIINAKYIIELNSQPITITIYDFDEPTLKQLNIEFQGTIKILNEKSFEMSGKQIISKSGDDKNPKFFNQPPIILKRISN